MKIMINWIKLAKKIDEDSSNPIEILDNRQNLIKIQFDQRTLGDLLTNLLMIPKFEKIHLEGFSILGFLKFEKNSPSLLRSIFCFKYFGWQGGLDNKYVIISEIIRMEFIIKMEKQVKTRGRNYG